MADIGNIRKRIDANSQSLKEGGAAALGTLILGGSKAEAALAGVGQAILTKVVGPLGKFIGLTAMATKGIYGMTKAWAVMGTSAAAKLETVENQLRVILKGLDAAKQRVRELRNFSIATPFKMGDIVAGNRALESLSRGALTTAKSMSMVGDAAAQAGVGFEDMAVYVGRLYDGLAGGRPVGEVLFRLAELGVISGQARTSLEALQESGAGFSAAWGVVEAELKRSAGTMDYTSKTLEGLQSTLEDTQDELKATFSENFMAGQKEAIEAQIKTLQNLKPAVQGVSDAFSFFVTAANTMGSKLTAMMTSIPLVSGALEFMARAVGLVVGGITLLGTVIGAANLVGMLGGLVAKMNLGSKAAAGLSVALRALGVSVTVAMGPVVAVAALLVVLVSAFTMYRDRVERTAKAQREYAGATDAMLDKMKAQREMIKSLDQLSASYASTLDALAQTYLDLAAAKAEGDKPGQANAEKRLAGLKNELTQKDGIDRGSLQKSQMTVDARAAREANERQVKAAEREAARATMSPSERAKSLEDEANELAGRRAQSIRETEGSEEYRQKVEGVRTAQRKNAAEQVAPQAAIQELAEAKKNAAKPGTPVERAAAAEALDKAAQKAADAEAALASLKKEEAELLRQEMQMAEAQDSEIVKLQAKLTLYAAWQAAISDVTTAENKLAELQKEPADESGDAQVERLKAIAAAELALQRQRETRDRLGGGAAGMDAAKEQEMQARLARLKQEAQTDNVNRPEEIAKRAEAAAAKREIVRNRLDEQGAARAQKARETGQTSDGRKMSGEDAQRTEEVVTEKARLALMLEQKQIDKEIYDLRMEVIRSQERLIEREKNSKRRGEFATEREQLAGETGAMSVAGGGVATGLGGDYARAKVSIETAKAELAMKLKEGEIDQTSYDLKMRVIESQERLLERERAKRNEEAAADLAVAQAGEDLGALAGAEEQVKQEQKKLDLAHQRGEIETSVYELQKKKLALTEQELARRKALAAGENAAGVQADQLKLEAQAARLGGRGAEARKLEEDAARIEEDAGKARRARELMDQTGMSKAEAEKQADTEVQRNRMGRELEREGGLFQALMGRGQQVDSLQRIGGGGGVSAAPDTKKVVERLDKLIQTVKGLNVGGAAQRLN
jgi:hypothetical protein